MIHALLTAVFCIFCLFLKLYWLVFFWPAMFYLGREIAQAEYRYIEAHGGRRGNYPWWCGFMSEAWTAKSLLDCFLPVLVSVLAAALGYTLKWL